MYIHTCSLFLTETPNKLRSTLMCRKKKIYRKVSRKKRD